MQAEAIAELAAARRIVLHELSAQSASLEEAYLELTRDSAEYRGGPGRTDSPSIARENQP